MNGIESVIVSVRKSKGDKQEKISQRNSNSVNNLPEDGILVETNKGLVCLPLKDTLNKRMTEPSFESDEFQTASTEMLFHEESEQIILPDSFWTDTTDSSKKLSKHLKGINNKKKDAWCKSLTLSNSFNASQVDLEEFKDFKDSLLDFSTLEYSFLDKITVDSEDINKKLSDSVVNTLVVGNNKCFGRKKSLILKNTIKPVISVKKIVKSLSNKNNMGSVLVNSNSTTQSVYESYVSNEETSDNSEVTSVVADEPEIKPTKKRGGWPKGRKRKPEVKYEVHPPKAPATGYVIFLNEKRKEYRDMPFTEVTKLLGNEWSKLSLQEKKVYLDQAEIEKKRYREELKLYRLSDAYQSYLNKKKLKRLQENGTEESDMDATDEIDEEDNEELYCRSCDQWFHSLHNKREHLYGRQHLQSIASRCSKMSDPDWCNPNMSSTSLDESSLDGSSYLKGNKEHCCTKIRESLNMDDAIVRFMVANKEREEERKILKKKLEEIKDRNQCLSHELQQLNETVDSLTCMMESERTTQILLEQRLFNLLNVPTLFYLPEPLNEDNS